MAFCTQTFAACFENLRAWLDKFGFLPYEKSNNTEEAQLARFVSKVRIAHGRRLLSQAQICVLEALAGWSWGDFEGESSGGTEGAHQRGKKRPCDEDVPGRAQARDAERVEKDEDLLEQWSHLTVGRLQGELKRQPDEMARRACLRHWQRTYHPDKNPGRVCEVRPIFQWVQSCWDRDFRNADSSTPAPHTESSERPSSSPSGTPQRSQATRVAANLGTSAQAVPAAALASNIRRRRSCKRPG